MTVGEPVLGTLYGGSGPIAYTHLLTVEEAVEVYGPVSEWVVGPQGGFRRVCFGETVFSSAELGRGFNTRTLPQGIVTVEDPDLDWPCLQCGAAPDDRCSGASKRRVRRARGEEYQRLQNEMSQLRETIAKLRKQNELLDEQVHAFRREQRKRVPICSRPTRAGQPCQADAINYPTPIESCRIHLTPEEKTMLAAAEAEPRAEFTIRPTGD
ncbi:hypothetical protein ACQP2E_37780 [Actinoplanes sp. CA-015351]|uniref:hypothetical protein n=1 Tax=Actinoplanes sp. CA-015351 TaxID=3239897 RepID=UPI003D971D7F